MKVRPLTVLKQYSLIARKGLFISRSFYSVLDRDNTLECLPTVQSFWFSKFGNYSGVYT